MPRPLVLVLGCLAAIALLTSCSGGSSADGGDGDGSPETTDTTLAPTTALPLPVAFAPGTCLTWDQSRLTPEPAVAVDCGEPHLLEVAQVIDLSTDYPTVAPWPGAQGFYDLVEARCTGPVGAYAGGRLDAFGRFYASVSYPTSDEWSRGSRLLSCGLANNIADENGKEIASTGRFDPDDQGLRFAPGTCLDGSKDVIDFKVIDCARLHHYEVIATIDLNGAFKRKPSADALNALIDRRCSLAAGTYLDPDAVKALGDRIGTWWQPIESESWDVGTRFTICGIEEYSSDGSLKDFTGSLAQGQST